MTAIQSRTNGPPSPKDFESDISPFMRAGPKSKAVAVPEHSVGELIRSERWEDVVRIAEGIGYAGIRSSPVLLAATLRAFTRLMHFDALEDILEVMNRDGSIEEVAAIDPIAVIAALGGVPMPPRQADGILERLRLGSAGAGVRYMLKVVSEPVPAEPPVRTSWKKRSIGWGLMLQGRLRDLNALLPAEGESWDSTSTLTTPHALHAPLWNGELTRARHLLESMPSEVRAQLRPDLMMFLEAQLLIAEGAHSQAEELTRNLMAHSRIHGSRFFRPIFQTVRGRALLSNGESEAAIDELSCAKSHSESLGLCAYAEWSRVFLAHAYLLEGRDDQAVGELTDAVNAMRQSGRILLLPFALGLLSEAKWRIGCEDESDSLASDALDAAKRSGSLYSLRLSAEHFSGIVERQLDLSPESEWRLLVTGGTPLRSSRVPRVSRSPLQGLGDRPWEARSGKGIWLHTFGREPHVIRDGEVVPIGRTKVLEFLAYLVLNGPVVSRTSLILALFPDSDRAKGSNYFRQARHVIKSQTGLVLSGDGERIALPTSPRILSSDQILERVLSEITLLGQMRAQSVRRALALMDGDYLTNSDLEWAEERRYRLNQLRDSAIAETGLTEVELMEDRAFGC